MESNDRVSTERTTSPPVSSERPPSALQGMGSSLRRRGRLARKELRESLRDRRTLVTLIMMPLIVYPLLGSVVQKFAISRIDPNAPAAIVIVDEGISHELQQSLFQRSPSTLPQKAEGRDGNDLNGVLPQIPGTDLQSTLEASPIRFEVYQKTDDSESEHLIGIGVVDVAVRELPPKPEAASGLVQPGELQILSRRNDPFSTRAAAEIERRVTEYRDRVIRTLLSQTRFGAESMPYVSRVAIDSAGPRESPLSAFVPLMLVLMTMTGAVYPAIDLTAGERERGTLEMLLAAPVPRGDLLLGKFVAVFTVAVLTALINLTAMILTLYGTGFDRVILGDGISVTMFLQVLALLVVFASFFSAVLLSVTSFSRSFREAQAWLIPLMLISLAPGILSLMPGVHLTPGLALIPLVNIVLLGKELFQGIASPQLFVLTLITTATYTVLALRLAAQIFGRDSVLFGGSSETGSLRKRPSQPVDHVSLRLGIGSLLVLAPAFIVLAGLRGRLVSPDNLPGQLVLSGMITILLFAAFPLALTFWNRVRFVPAFAFRGFQPLALLGAAVLGMTAWTVTYEVLLLSKGSLGWTKLLDNPKLQELAQRLTQDTPLLLRLLTLAIIPAVCEEMFFRGFLMSALQGKSRRWRSALLVSTFLFAAFHVVVDQSLTFERFPATFLLGFVLGAIRLTSGSLFPGIAMHAISNGVLLSLSDLEPSLQKLGLNPGTENQVHLPAWFLIVSTILAVVGSVLVWMGTGGPQRHQTELLADSRN